MRRLNVQFSQIEECIRLSLFAVDMLPQNPPLERGEELLLQLVKADADRLRKLDSRIDFALIFDRVEEDRTGDISRLHWPNAGKVWKYILHCSETVPTVPLSLERLKLNRDYAGQINPMYIEPNDAVVVGAYIKGRGPTSELGARAGVRGLLAAIRNYDTVTRLAPVRLTSVREHGRRLSDPWLGDALKQLYEHRCQICLHDFCPRYGVPFADTRFVTDPDRGGQVVSHNVVVLCPNHDAIIGAAGATFDWAHMAWLYPNGLIEKLTLRDHLLP